MTVPLMTVLFIPAEFASVVGAKVSEFLRRCRRIWAWERRISSSDTIGTGRLSTVRFLALFRPYLTKLSSQVVVQIRLSLLPILIMPNGTFRRDFDGLERTVADWL